MTATSTPFAPEIKVPTLNDLLDRFGDMPANRLRWDRYPASEEDVLEIRAQQKRLCELIDDILVEKVMGAPESNIAFFVAHLIQTYLMQNNIGVVFGADGMMKLWPGRIRIPDASFVPWDQFPGAKIGPEPVPSIYPDLAVEVLSESNTRKEMWDKREDYFKAGTRLVWLVDPDARTVEVYTPDRPHEPTTFGELQTVVGDPVLPGFGFVVGELFERVARK